MNMVYVMDIALWYVLGHLVGHLGGFTGIRREFNYKSLLIAIAIGLGGIVMGLILQFMPDNGNLFMPGNIQNGISLFGLPIGGADWLFTFTPFQWQPIIAAFGFAGASLIYVVILIVVYIIPAIAGFYLGKKLYLSLEKRGYV